MKDRLTDAWTDGRIGKIMLLSQTLTIRGSDVTSLAEFHPVV